MPVHSCSTPVPDLPEVSVLGKPDKPDRLRLTSPGTICSLYCLICAGGPPGPASAAVSVYCPAASRLKLPVKLPDPAGLSAGQPMPVVPAQVASS